MNLIKKALLRIVLFYAYGYFGGWIFTLIEKKEESGSVKMERMLQELKNHMRMKYNMTDGDFNVVVEKASQATAAGDEIDWTFFNSCGFTFAAITTIGTILHI